MNVNEILNAAQALTFEERRQLLHGLFSQMPKMGGLAGTITEVRDLDTGSEDIQAMVRQSLERTAKELGGDIGEPE